MSNSSLVSYTRISPNRNSPRKQPIRKITLHHMAGSMSLEAFGALVAKPSRQMSANYAIDTDGSIGLFCPEADRSWCSSSRANDQQAITVEIANDGGAPDWHVSDAALEAAIRLCVDVCQRNGMPGLTWTSDSSGTLTCHYMFAATACPGPYLKGKMAWIAAEVNRRLAAGQGAAGDTGALAAGAELHLTRCPLYVASTATSAAGTVTGTYWLWDAEQIGGRVRITNAAERVGQAGQVTGWISVSDASAALAGGNADKPGTGTTLTIGPVSSGDRATIRSKCQELQLEAMGLYREGEAGGMYTITVGPLSAGYVDALRALCEQLQLVEMGLYKEG